VRQQPVDTVGGRLQPFGAGARQTVGIRVDPDHPYRLEMTAALELIHEVGADVA